MPTNQTDKIYQRLVKIKGRAMSQYSHYSVGALVDTDKGYFEGFNIECSVFPLTMCAERVALYSAFAHGASKIKSLALLTDSVGPNGTPCGSCRQVMIEHMDAKAKVKVYQTGGRSRTYTVAQLLPHAFDSNEIKAGGK